VKLTVVRFVYEPPALQITPETEYESAVLQRYWAHAELTVGKADESFNGWGYGIRFKEGGQKVE